jgi:serine/threonine-protein kinase
MKIPIRYISSSKPMYGGFSKATIFNDTNLDRFVIIKEIEDPEEKHRLLNEIKALQKAKSKNVVEIYDVIYDEDNYCIVEEYLPGKDLMDYKPESVHKFLKDAYQLASGITDLHHCGIVHRDFKPNNIKYDAENILKIFDFGLAKHNKFPTTTINNPGAQGFMAPELFNSPPKIDKPIDIYALGVTLFYMASSMVPAFCKKVPPAPPDSSFTIKKYIDIPDKIASIFDSCLAVNPEDRPTAKKVKKAIERELLAGKHRAVFVVAGVKYELHSGNKGVKINRDTDSAIISYDGYNFNISDVTGNIYVNNTPVTSKRKIEGSCVIILGGQHLKNLRNFVPFDINHPEVVI